MKAATPCRLRAVRMCGISIHAAREGGDLYRIYKSTIKVISIHAAREGGDAFRRKLPEIADISIHAAREGGDAIPRLLFGAFPISIHAAREGGDQGLRANALLQWLFQSTPPVKAATSAAPPAEAGGVISIHAAREGGDT